MMTPRPARFAAMARRVVVLVLVAGLLAVPRVGGSQQAGKVYRIGFLSAFPTNSVLDPFLEALREHGWVEGQNFRVEPRYVGPRLDAADTAARERVDLRVDVIVTIVSGTAVAARRATTQIPIVMITSGYPVEAGLAESLVRPGRNVTGNSPYAGEDIFG